MKAFSKWLYLLAFSVAAGFPLGGVVPFSVAIALVIAGSFFFGTKAGLISCKKSPAR